jgi:arylsulfatase A-like enzyme
MPHVSLTGPLKSLARFLWGPLHGSATEPARRREYGEVLSLAFTICLVLFVVKEFIAYRDLDRDDMPPAVCRDGFWVTTAQVWACSAQDFAVGFGCVLVGGIGLRLLRSRRGRRRLRIAAHVAALAALGYMVVNAQLFHVLRCFLTLSIFQAGGGFTPERSIYFYVTPALKASLALLPVLALAGHLLMARKLAWFWTGALTVIGRPWLLLAGIAGLCYVTVETQHTLFWGHRIDFTENAHLLLARSLFREDMGFHDMGPEPVETADYLPGQPRHAGARSDKRPTNVIVIVLECGSAHYFDICGYGLPTTPRLRELGPRSLTCDNIYATSNRTIAAGLPLCASMWNDPHTIATTMEYTHFPVPAVSSWMQQQGYKTAFLGAGGDLVWDGGYFNLQPAFTAAGWDVKRDVNSPFWAAGGKPDRFRSADYLDKAMFADARRFIRSAAKDKFFLMLWNYDTHTPFFGWNGGPAWDESQFPTTVRGRPQEEEFRRYLNALHSTDALIGALLEELEGLGLADDTLVVVTADHGEAWGQHGTFAHGSSLFDEEVRVPLVLINRQVAEAAGTRSKIVGGHVDIWPTITDICGLPFNPAWQGRSLLGPDVADNRAYFSRCGSLGVREGRFKYIWDYEARREYLFDMTVDPGERKNLATERREDCLRLRRRLRDWTVFQTDLTKKRMMEARRP